MTTLIGANIPVLDHGFVRLVDTMGDDAAIVQAARVSYGEGTKSMSEDAALIRYLLRHQHTTPFEMCEIKLHCKMPIFVARQWIRHRTANVNEVSARYSVLGEECYVPEPEHVAYQDTANRQGRGEAVEAGVAEGVASLIDNATSGAHQAYQHLLGLGVARELARTVLPVGAYTEWYWKIDLHNLFHFLHLRLDHHAQYEIRAYAEAIMTIVKAWVPVAAQAFEDYVLNAVTFSAREMAAIRAAVAGVTVWHPEDLHGRELAEFKAKLGR